MDHITLASLLLAAGAGIAGGILTLLVDVLKVPFPNVNGLVVTFVASLVLYLLVFINGNVFTVEQGFEVFLAWLTCASAAFGLHKTVLNGPSEFIGQYERKTS